MEDEIHRSPGFTISCENPEFQSKLHDVFCGIDASASNMASDSAIESGEDCDDDEQPNEACFKIPKRPPRKPDYVLNPSRYTKYSLEDTEISDNKANSAIAFEFLHELSQRESLGEMDVAETQVKSEKHIFKMPEHVVGLSKPQDRKKIENKHEKAEIHSCDKIELEHLEENISAAEFANEVAAKLDESISKITEQIPATSDKEKFKHVNKKKRNLRSKSHEDD